MVYATLQQFIEAFGQQLTIELTNLENAEATEIDEAVFDRSAARAAGLINGYLAGRYALPLAKIPDVLKSIALDIQRYQMGHNAQEEDVRQRYEDALRLLEQLAKGQISLGLPAADTPPALGRPQWTTRPRVFSPDRLRNY